MSTERETQNAPEKEAYDSPEIVSLGDAVELTAGAMTQVQESLPGPYFYDFVPSPPDPSDPDPPQPIP
jgi:hypothetical protein